MAHSMCSLSFFFNKSRLNRRWTLSSTKCSAPIPLTMQGARRRELICLTGFIPVSELDACFCKACQCAKEPNAEAKISARLSDNFYVGHLFSQLLTGVNVIPRPMRRVLRSMFDQSNSRTEGGNYTR
ncbi:hypothetical protein AcV5_000950 [Taiwanofungus camphoratus]|nr:hypothetical protein AcV5_000950 [Antrodia cinnamomea]